MNRKVGHSNISSALLGDPSLLSHARSEVRSSELENGLSSKPVSWRYGVLCTVSSPHCALASLVFSLFSVPVPSHLLLSLPVLGWRVGFQTSQGIAHTGKNGCNRSLLWLRVGTLRGYGSRFLLAPGNSISLPPHVLLTCPCVRGARLPTK